MNRKTLIISLVLLAVLLVFGCGQKGDLVLPDDAKVEKQKKKKPTLF